jgi:hypothetical protein
VRYRLGILANSLIVPGAAIGLEKILVPWVTVIAMHQFKPVIDKEYPWRALQYLDIALPVKKPASSA